MRQIAIWLCLMLSAFSQVLIVDDGATITLKGRNVATKNINGIRFEAQFSGASVVERIQNAITDCAGAPCVVYVSPGDYTASSCDGWQGGNVSLGPQKVGVLIPSNTAIIGSGRGVTKISYTRAAEDPLCSLFTNQNFAFDGGDHDISITGITLSYTETGAPTQSSIQISIEGVEGFSMSGMTLTGNSGKQIMVNDSTQTDIHNNTFILNTTGTDYGNSALTLSRFNATNPDLPGGKIHDNTFVNTGTYENFSELIVAQSSVSVTGNIFDLAFSRTPTNTGNAIEIGVDNFGLLSQGILISNNTFYGGSTVGIGCFNCTITNNHFHKVGLSVGPIDGSNESVSRVAILVNHFEPGDISFKNLGGSFAGTSEISGNVVEGSITVGAFGSILSSDVIVANNMVRDSPSAGINCRGCSIVRGNTVKNVGQSDPSGGGNIGYVVQSPLQIFADNSYVEDQQTYSTGTICSVATYTGTTCLTSGTSKWVYVTSGTWAYGWTNRTMYTARGNYTIRAFINSAHVELEAAVAFIPASTAYNLYATTAQAAELNTATIGQFTGNVFQSPNGAWRVTGLQEDVPVTFGVLKGNSILPYACRYCANDYRAP